MGKTSLYAPRQVWLRRLATYIPYLAVGLILVIFPSFVPIYVKSIMTKALIFAIFAMSLNLLSGYTGIFSLGHAAYLGVGGYVAGILMVRYGVESFWLAAPAGILMATLAAAFFGVFVLRVTGIYCLMVTVAISLLLSNIAVKWSSMTGGTNGLIGIKYPDLGLPWLSINATSFYYMVFVFFIIVIFLLYRFQNSPFGCALPGIRESELRMRSLGYNTWLYKYVAFVVGGLFAGVAGVLYAYYGGIMAPGHLGLLTSAIVVLMVIIGGDRIFLGPVVGAILVIFLEYYSNVYTPQRWPLVLGAVFVIAVMFLRGGISLHLVKLWDKVKYRYGSTQS